MESNSFKAALNLIPNGTFPTGSVVKSLVALGVLGLVRLLLFLIFRTLVTCFQKIRDTRKDACDFALKVVADLSPMADAFGVTPSNIDEPDGSSVGTI